MKSSLAQREFPQEKCLTTRRSSRKTRTQLFTVPAPVTKPAEQFCAEPLPCISHGSSSSKVDWQPGKRRVIRSSPTTSLSISTSQPSSGKLFSQELRDQIQVFVSNQVIQAARKS